MVPGGTAEQPPTTLGRYRPARTAFREGRFAPTRFQGGGPGSLDLVQPPRETRRPRRYQRQRRRVGGAGAVILLQRRLRRWRPLPGALPRRGAPCPTAGEPA